MSGLNKNPQIGALRRRGMSLTHKFAIVQLLVTLLITLLVGLVAASNLQERLLDGLKRSGYREALALHAYAQSVVQRLKGVRDSRDFWKILEVYRSGVAVDGTARADASCAQDRAYLKRMLNGDQHIKDVAVLASPDARDQPEAIVVRGDDAAATFAAAPERGLPVKVANPDPDVSIYWGEYRGERCLYFRVPLEKGAEGKGVHSVVVLVLSTGDLDEQARSLRNRIFLVGMLLAAASAGLALALASKITRPIKTLVEDINAVAKGDLDHESDVPNKTGDEVGLLAMAFNRMTRSLRDAQESDRDRERMESEMNSAKAIHANLLPAKMPQIPGLDIFTAYNCAKEVGGDYYDFIPVGDAEHLAFCVADVSGKGIPGSMVMGTTRTILRMMAVNNLSPADVLSKTNFHVARDIKRGMFVTCIYAILNVRTKDMTVASAGHTPMLVWRAATKSIEEVRLKCLALGMDKGPVFNRMIRDQKVQLHQGDRVVLYTDGVTECMNEQRQQWGDEALRGFTLRNATLPSKEYGRLLYHALEEHQGRAEQHDDIAITTFRITGDANG